MPEEYDAALGHVAWARENTQFAARAAARARTAVSLITRGGEAAETYRRLAIAVLDEIAERETRAAAGTPVGTKARNKAALEVAGYAITRAKEVHR